MTTMQVAHKLVALCREMKFKEAIDQLYAKDVVSIEAADGPTGSRTASGIEAVRAKNDWWARNHDVHSFEAIGPFPHDDRFAIYMALDVTAKGGPMAGNRLKLEEIAIYTVKDGKVVREEFFYSMDG